MQFEWSCVFLERLVIEAHCTDLLCSVLAEFGEFCVERVGGFVVRNVRVERVPVEVAGSELTGGLKR